MKVTRRTISNLLILKKLLTKIRYIVQHMTFVTHTEIEKTVRNILLIELKIYFDKALQLAVTASVSMAMINIQLI